MKTIEFDAIDPYFYNPVINGNLDIHQRFGDTVLTRTNLVNTGGLDADRMHSATTAGVAKSYSIQRSPVVPPSVAYAAFSRQVTNNTAIPSFPTGEYLFPFGTYIEGTVFQPIGQKPLSIGFWYFTSVGGIIPVAFQRAGITRSYVTTIIATPNVYEYHVVNIPADVGVYGFGSAFVDTCRVAIGAVASTVSTTFQAPTLNTWNAGDFWTHPTATNVFATAGAVIRISQLQVRSGFRSKEEMRDGYIPFAPTFAQELLACQRYYQLVSHLTATVSGATTVAAWSPLHVDMRANPVVGQTGTLNLQATNAYNGTQTAVSAFQSVGNSRSLYLANLSNWPPTLPAVGHCLTLAVPANNGNYITADADF